MILGETFAKENAEAIPFLKWAGGKRWLVKSEHQIVPKKFHRFFEPFLGSAAVFFSLTPPKSILADSNAELINTYTALRDEHETVKKLLTQHHNLHCEEYYYQIRSATPGTNAAAAARFIYLNRTCWNGLYRVNLKGAFNVPIGTKTSVILESDNFSQTSQYLQKSKIVCQDFEKTIDQASKGDFIFVDPPYTVKHNHNGFVKYNETIFSWEDQIRLRDALTRARDRGARITVSNADHESIVELYSCADSITRAQRKSVLAARSNFRGSTTELIIKFGWK